MKKRTSLLSLRTRMILLFIPVIVLTLLVTGMFAYFQTQRVIRQQRTDMVNNMLEKSETSLSSSVERAVKTTEQILYFTPVYQAIFGGTDKTSSEQVDAFRTMTNFMTALEEQFGYVRMRMFTRNTSLLYQQEGTRFFSFDRLTKDIPVDINVTSRMDQIRIVDSYFSPARKDSGNSYWLISVVRLIVDGPEHFVRAAISVDMDCEKLLDDWVLSDYQLTLITPEGRILASTDDSLIGSSIPETLCSRMYAARMWQEQDMCYLSRKVAGTDWQLYVTLPNSFILEDTQSILTTIVWMIVLACLLAVAAVILISRALTSRLRLVTQTMEQTKDRSTLPDVLEMRILERPGDCAEIGVLVQAYNRMLDRIGQLSKENEHMVLRESRYRMEALRLQINSHFLYNTLASIKGYIEINEAQTASRLLMELASFFNHSLDRSGVFITLREEIEIIEIYLHIQQLVYTDMFSFEIQIPPEMLETRIPKFLLQPIIENALIHGVAESREHGMIRVLGKVTEQRIEVRVQDNGPGFNQEQLRLTEDARRRDKRCGLGMRNVATRLKLYFGNKACMTLENPPEGGGCVIVCLPAGGLTEEEADAYGQDTFGGR